MKVDSPQQLEIAVGNAGSGLRAADPSRRCARVFCLCPWGRGRNDPCRHGGSGAGPGRTRRGDAALSVSLYGEGQQAARPAGDRARRRARGGGGSRAMLSGTAPDRGRPILRRPHDLAGAGGRAARRRRRAGVFRLSAASGRQAVRSIAPNISPISRSRCCSCRAPTTSSRSWRCSNPWSSGSGQGPRCIWSRVPIIPSTCRRARAATTARSWTKSSMRSRAGSSDDR